MYNALLIKIVSLQRMDYTGCCTVGRKKQPYSTIVAVLPSCGQSSYCFIRSDDSNSSSPTSLALNILLNFVSLDHQMFSLLNFFKLQTFNV